MIDLRSDTVTLPTPAMRDAMAAAPVGDDVYGDDPTVNALEARTAELLGKEAAVFVPTGTMSNQIGVRAHTEPGDLVLIDGSAHIVRSESGAPAALSGVTLKPLPGRSGVFTAADVDVAIEPEHPFNPTHLESPPRLLCVENTHNGGGGTVWPLGQVEEVCAAARRHGLATHLDGARLWHATAATGVPEARYCAPFDTVNVCFSKGLGAPVGSALAGSGELVARARRFKQQFGGGFRQAGILAAAALHALEHHRDGLPADVANARALARGIARIDGLEVDLDHVQSNLVRFRVTAMPAGAFATRCHSGGVHLLPQGETGVRAVTHRDISAPDVECALDIMRHVLCAACPG
ncbi:MAG: aminotransferase class I/II-fold pyridoxal phosphate-dependent enzyme [Gammaproteobacteria bacterium]|nr:aminotransferase class I/II-fold pyridoxal phosphate-dependent enzyme [Gammaproteobacteria bacterium]MYF60580.1 aminotransferase class I/II-fold pyridoxal phosphate-dependent enzyme [Gammaproteobacteria bacterium]MYI23460.1 aminotransferase class I/II-fold pyridoxal phosphate-dependent enzyme [Gammaproteobacteria bacterium]